MFTKTWLKRYASTFLIVFGTLWLILEPGGFFFPDYLQWGIKGYVFLVIAALLASLIKNAPSKIMSTQFSSSQNFEINIKIGDIFDESGHLVIGTNDVYDTQLGEIISPNSIQGQFLQKIYNGDVNRLDREIQQALDRKSGLESVVDQNKAEGKNKRFPIGTVITLGFGSQRYFLSAYAKMGNDLITDSDPEIIFNSLLRLWEEVRMHGQNNEVSIPIIGSELARAGLSRHSLIRLIAVSFVVASKKRVVTSKLNIIIYPSDMDKPNMDIYAFEDFIKELKTL